MNSISRNAGKNAGKDKNGVRSKGHDGGGTLDGGAGFAGSKIRVLIVDDHPVVRDGLEALLVLQLDMEICAYADTVSDAMAAVDKTRPDVAVVDISLKEGDGIDLVKRISAFDKSIRVVVWSMYGEGLYAERALRAGAMGYVHKSTSTAEILRAIRSALAGKVYLSAGFTTDLVSRLMGGAVAPGVDLLGRGQAHLNSLVESLSDRELEVFTFIGQGLRTEKVAQQMCLSRKTVETYCARIKDKLGLDHFTALVRRAALWVKESS